MSSAAILHPPGMRLPGDERKSWKVWYADQAKMDSRWKYVVMNDRGELRHGDGEVEFVGRKFHHRGRVESVALVRPAFPLWVWVIQTAILAAASIVGFVMLAQGMWTQGMPLAAGGIGGLVVGLPMGLFINRRQRFVRIEALEGEQRAVFYVHAAAGLGWAALLGAHEYMLERLAP